VEPRNTRLGVASFVISVVAGALFFVACGYMVYLELITPGALQDNSSSKTVLLGLSLIGLFLLELLAVGLGIAGILQKESKKSLAVLGTVFSGVAILLFVAAVILGHLLP
jgi:hypothetical protein